MTTVIHREFGGKEEPPSTLLVDAKVPPVVDVVPEQVVEELEQKLEAVSISPAGICDYISHISELLY
jgi:hypothetical protein